MMYLFSKMLLWLLIAFILGIVMGYFSDTSGE